MNRLTLPAVYAPDGFRWANGGGSPIGGCNGYHLASEGVRGTLCGRFGPYTPPNPRIGAKICGSCARIAGIPAILGEASNQESRPE